MGPLDDLPEADRAQIRAVFEHAADLFETGQVGLKSSPAGDPSPAELRRVAQWLARRSWAATPDRIARTAPGRAAADARFEREVDPDGTLDPAERATRAAHARSAHCSRIAVLSAQARRRNRQAAATATPDPTNTDQDPRLHE